MIQFKIRIGPFYGIEARPFQIAAESANNHRSLPVAAVLLPAFGFELRISEAGPFVLALAVRTVTHTSAGEILRSSATKVISYTEPSSGRRASLRLPVRLAKSMPAAFSFLSLRKGRTLIKADGSKPIYSAQMVSSILPLRGNGDMLDQQRRFTRQNAR